MANRRRQPHHHVFEPVPVSYLNAVLQSFWDEYAGRRIEGMDPDGVTSAVNDLLDGAAAMSSDNGMSQTSSDNGMSQITSELGTALASTRDMSMSQVARNKE